MKADDAACLAHLRSARLAGGGVVEVRDLQPFPGGYTGHDPLHRRHLR